ncbi:MAG: anaerobic ribonucleoside-triphosphate reductase [Syntrophobacterales bacterium]|nr:anaerobic ribonucleoside-triphosphate reductase [Syntrophobacterales bacterium]
MSSDLEQERRRNAETTDITLFVRTSGEESAQWNRRMIVEALIREAQLDEATADEISKEVEKQIFASGIGMLTTALIRELVDARLIERGMEQARRLHARLGFPLYDVRQLIFHRNKENANVPHDPEGTNLALVEGIKREYALHDVFSREIVEAHVSGDIHLHGLGYVDRPYGFFQSLEYLKLFGLKLPNFVTVAAPARHPEVLLAHMVRFGASLQGHISGMIGWDAVNISFAPYLAGMEDGQIEQFAQMLVYEFSQLTSSRGGQAIFTDIHLYWEVPDFISELPAIGPGGKPTGRTFREHGEDARRFARALMRVYRKGDAAGKPFIFPRPIVHITERFFQTAGHEAFLEEACGAAAAMGNPCFVLERGAAVGLAPGAGFAFPGVEAKEPCKRRYASIQNVTINLPRLGYRALEMDDDRLFSLLDETLAKAVKAHLQKRDFIERLLASGDSGPLAMLGMKSDGLAYLRMSDAVYLVGMTGLNELVKIRTKGELHDSEEALVLGMAIIGYMKEEVERLSASHGMKFLLEQTPAETTAYRFARLDLKSFSPLAGHYVLGNIAKNEIYYTNSTHLRPSAPVDPLTRILREGHFHPFVQAGSVTNIELGASEPPASELAELIMRAFRETRNNQIVFSPEFTSCLSCGAAMRGLRAACSFCGSKEVDGLARITQYYSFTSGWNRGKRAELNDRRRVW